MSCCHVTNRERAAQWVAETFHSFMQSGDADWLKAQIEDHLVMYMDIVHVHVEVAGATRKTIEQIAKLATDTEGACKQIKELAQGEMWP